MIWSQLDRAQSATAVLDSAEIWMTGMKLLVPISNEAQCKIHDLYCEDYQLQSRVHTDK